MINVTSFIKKKIVTLVLRLKLFSRLIKAIFYSLKVNVYFKKNEQIKKHEIEQNVTF